MIAAFVYDTYYCHGIKRSFAGLYKDEEKALETIRGSRYESQHLELMDLETCGIKEYDWLPLYKDDQETIMNPNWKEGGTFEDRCISTLTLTHRWDKDQAIIEATWDGPVRKWGHANVFYEAGEWRLL